MHRHLFSLIYLGLCLTCQTSTVYAAGQIGEARRALSLKPDLENGRNVYRLCATCHYPTGWGKHDGSFPVIAGQHREVIIKQLADIRARKRENPTMFPFIDKKTIGDAQSIADVAAYVARLPPDPEPGKGDGRQLDEGKKLYQQKCSRCHGKSGNGNAALFYPKLRGQHYAYLLRQLQWMKTGFRKNANPAMLTQIRPLSGPELEALADYISRL